MTWLTNWNYRKAITMTNTGSALTDYQVSITVDTASLISSVKMRPDCGDIRFTDSDGSALLPYWIESGVNTSSTKIWTKIPLIPIGTKTIYLYYGNPSATYDNSAGGTNTFIQFHGAATASYQDTPVKAIPFVYESKYKRTSNTGWLFIGVSNQQINYPFGSGDDSITISDQNANQHYHISHNNGVESYGNGTIITLNTYYNIKIVAISSSKVDYYKYDRTTLSATLTTNIPDATMGLNAYLYQGTSLQQDWSFIRQYAATEPTSTLGSEQTPSNITAFSMSISPSESPCRKGICTLTINVTWTNNGGSTGTFTPGITVDGNLTTLTAEDLNSGLSVTKTFIISNLTAGNHEICPVPN